MENMSSSSTDKEPLCQPVARIRALLTCRMKLTKQPFKHDCRSSVMHLSHLDVDLIQHARQPSQGRHARSNEPNKH